MGSSVLQQCLSEFPEEALSKIVNPGNVKFHSHCSILEVFACKQVSVDFLEIFGLNLRKTLDCYKY